MPVPRGLVPPAIVASTIILIVCAVGWGALGMIATTTSVTLDPELFRFLSASLGTGTVCSVLINLAARLARILRAIRPEPATDDGYADGYSDGLAAGRAGTNGARVAQIPSRGLIRS